MKELKELLAKVVGLAATITVIVVAAAYFLLGLAAIQPLSPTITILLVLVLTMSTLDERETAFLSVGGIAIYVLSWPITSIYGLPIGLLVWALGIVAWFWAVLKSIFGPFIPKPAPIFEATRGV